MERQLASIERKRNANYPVTIWHPAEQEAAAQAIAVTLQQWGFPVTRRVVENSQGGLSNTPVVVNAQEDGKRTAEWIATRASYATYLQKATLFTWDEAARASQAALGIPNQADFIVAGRPESGSRVILPRRLSRLPTDPVGTPVSFQDRFAKGSLGPVVTVMPSGSILFGASDSGGYGGPTPQVDITQMFAISQREVTVDEFARFVAETGYRTDAEKDEGSGFCGGDGAGSIANRSSWRAPAFNQTGSHPVVCVSWNDAQAYIAWLSERTGETYRLPSESEWEYSARDAADMTRHPWKSASEACMFANVGDLAAVSGDGSTISNDGPYPCDDGARNTAPVASYPASRLGLYDMLGNASEWVQDCWESQHENVPSDGRAYETEACTSRTIRGSDWQTFADMAEFVNRESLAPTASSTTLGFRVVRQLAQPVHPAAAN